MLCSEKQKVGEAPEGHGSSSSGAMDSTEPKDDRVHARDDGGEQQATKYYKHSEESSSHPSTVPRTGMYSLTFAWRHS